MSQLSFFDEKRGVVVANMDWGQWWQTVHELHLKIPLPPGIKSKQIKVDVKPSFICVTVADKKIIEVSSLY